MALILVEKKIENGKTLLHYKKNGVDIYRCFSRATTIEEDNVIENNIKDNFVKVKTEKLIETKFGQIKKSQKKAFDDFVDTQLQQIEAKRLALNV